MSLPALLRIGWVALAADVGYWVWAIKQPEGERLSSWHAALNAFLYYGGALLFVILAILSYTLWRVSQRTG